jgi:hypothetical protein
VIYPIQAIPKPTMLIIVVDISIRYLSLSD